MRKNHRTKRPTVGSTDFDLALEFTGEIILLPNVIKTFSVHRHFINGGDEHKRVMSTLGRVAGAMGESGMAADCDQAAHGIGEIRRKLTGLSANKWVAGMRPAFRVREFSRLLDSCVACGMTALASTDPETALMFGENQKPPAGDLRQLAYVSAHEQLLYNARDARWLSLALFSIGRAISVNSNRAFGADTWDDVTFMWFDLEKSFLFSDGSAFATAITAMDRKIFDGDLSQIVGGRLPQGLAEMAINAHQTRYFVGL